MSDFHIHHLHHVPHAMIISAISLVKILVVAQFHPAQRYHPSGIGDIFDFAGSNGLGE